VSGDRYAGLPHTDDVAHPSTRFLYGFRWTGRAALRAWYDLRLHATGHVPRTGPVILCSNHIGIADGPILAVAAPRPVHSLTKIEMFRGRTGRFLEAVGQIPIDRGYADVHAIELSVKVLRAGHVLGVYPEGARGDGELRRFAGGAAYLAMVTGAPVVPVIMLGSRLPGHAREALPPRGARIDIVFGEQFHTEQRPWPRRPEQVAGVSELLKEHMLVTLEAARASTGRDLPGPLPSL
jgi:1-acyl-sn-glycerol-3-phosphate acyltransferase